jgi:hypothetical protein
MKKMILAAGLLAACSIGVFGQEPDGKDIATAIPIFFGQAVTDIGDEKAAPVRVYKITLARGQQFTADASSALTAGCCWQLSLWGPSERNVASLNFNNVLSDSGRRNMNNGLKVSYLVPAAGTYYLVLFFQAPGAQFTLRATAEGTPIAVPNPASAGCLNGKVDSMLYSLQRIAAGLPDEVTIGGQRACATCTVKPPLYPEISNRLEGALRSGVNVEACYDSAGSIFQLKLLRQ